MADKKEKSPYKDHTIEEVIATEKDAYYIQIDNTMFESPSGKLAFTKERADKFYEQVMHGLLQMRESGTEAEKKEAIECLTNLRIVPLRFH
jgi:hypothetical protein